MLIRYKVTIEDTMYVSNGYWKIFSDDYENITEFAKRSIIDVHHNTNEEEIKIVEITGVPD